MKIKLYIFFLLFSTFVFAQQKRVLFIDELVPVFQKYYAYISDDKEEIALD